MHESVCGDVSQMVAVECRLCVSVLFLVYLTFFFFFWSLRSILTVVSLSVILVIAWFRCDTIF